MLNQLRAILIVPAQLAMLATQKLTGVACEWCHENFSLNSVVYQFRGKLELNQSLSNHFPPIAKPISPFLLFGCWLTVPRDVVEERTVETIGEVKFSRALTETDAAQQMAVTESQTIVDG